MNGEPSAQFSIVEPSAGVEVNVTRWFRLDAGASYRFMSGVSIPGESSERAFTTEGTEDTEKEI